MSVVPSQIRLRHYADACKITVRVARTRLQRVGILDLIGRRQAVVGDSRLRERLPDDYERVYLWYESKARAAANE